ncbi:uncharacterized protein LOC106657409 [Trichogramma pretiosum]|uniref:uncharacterized protein LOC106657409 n=1 Tax=Trichogramma pretiosum TaxID=7493 RepID=UPI0006C9E4C1|nr:uncharacterized protein LOC106657409 [Trichogramma pretiosum]
MAEKEILSITMAGRSRRCSIPECDGQNVKVLYEFPKEACRKRRWLSACGMDDANEASSLKMFACNSHFVDHDYIPASPSIVPILKRTAVPVIKLSGNVTKSPTSKMMDKNISNTNENNSHSKTSEQSELTLIASNQEKIKVDSCTHMPDDNQNIVLNNSKNSKTENYPVQHKKKIQDVNLKCSEKLENSKIEKKIFSDSKNTGINKNEILKYISPKSEEINSVNALQSIENNKIEIDRLKIKTTIDDRNESVAVKEKVQAKTKPTVIIQSPNSRFRKNIPVIPKTLCAGCGKYCTIVDDDIVGAKRPDETLAAETLLELQEVDPSNEDEQAILIKKGIEICDKVMRKESIKLINLITNDNELVAFTGIDFKLLEKLTKAMTIMEGGTGKTYSETAKERIVLTLCKIRINLPFRCLGLLFGFNHIVSASLFYSTIRNLSSIMTQIIYWPRREEILKKLPACYHNYKQTRLVLHCTEMQVVKQRCTSCRELLVANNKEYESIKLVLGIAPSGLIIFKSNTYDTQDENESIFTKIKILTYLDPAHDAILDDKTLDITNECSKWNISLVKLPTMEKNNMYNTTDVELIKNIAIGRLHVDRTLHRFKTFKITQKKLSWRALPCIDEICTVIAAIINLKNPYFSEESFKKFPEWI